MDVRAIVVIGAASESSESAEQINSGKPYALVDVLGRPTAFRIIDRLKQHDIRNIAVITDAPANLWPSDTGTTGNWISIPYGQLWKTAEQVFVHWAQDGAESIVIVRVGPYTEIDYNDFLQFHFDRHANVTSAVDARGIALDVYVVSAGHRNEAAYMFRNRLRAFRSQPETFSFTGYVNHLSSPNHLRELAIEGLMQRIQLAPEGQQTKPGVWVGRGAKVHKRARILSPAFIGAASRVRAAAVVTRCTALEHDTVVDCGTVVENVTALPFTCIGAGLDLRHAVVGRSRLFNLTRGVEVDFDDPRLIGETPSRSPLRTLGSLVSLASSFSAQFLHGLFASSHRESRAAQPGSVTVPSTAPERPAPIAAKTAPSVDAGEFPSQLAVARRYGNE